MVAADAVAYKALRDEALRTAPDAFTSDYESSVGRDASEYVARFGALESGQFFLGAFDAAGQLLGCLGCEREQRAKQRHSATLVGMMVAPHAQRQGMGRALLHACVAGVEGESLLFGLDRAGIAASGGSACAAGAVETSHVLAAMGVPPALARGALRLSLGHTSTEADVERVLAVLPELIARLRSLG